MRGDSRRRNSPCKAESKREHVIPGEGPEEMRLMERVGGV